MPNPGRLWPAIIIVLSALRPSFSHVSIIWFGFLGNSSKVSATPAPHAVTVQSCVFSPQQEIPEKGVRQTTLHRETVPQLGESVASFPGFRYSCKFYSCTVRKSTLSFCLSASKMLKGKAWGCATYTIVLVVSLLVQRSHVLPVSSGRSILSALKSDVSSILKASSTDRGRV